VVVTAECIYFGKCDTREAVEVLDYIPLLEIKQQSLVEDKKPEKTAASSTPLSDVQQPSVLWTNEEDAEALTITIKTSHDGHNSGRSTILMANNEAEKSEWKSFLLSAVQLALENQRFSLREGLSFSARMQLKLRNMYSSKPSE